MYWKVQVETFDNGTVNAAVTGSREDDAPPPRRVKQWPGMFAEDCWFDSEEKAEAFAAEKRAEGKQP
jgi:hypothetical protein